MYPLYWTTSKEGLFMRYSFEFKLKCVELYRSGRWPKTPNGISTHNFHNTIRTWSEIEKRNGPEALKHPKHQRKWSSEDKLTLVSQVLSGNSLCSVACSAGINSGMLCQWVRRYREKGYNGLINKPKGRKPRKPSMKKKININNPRPIKESEYEELIRLRAENDYIKAENAVIKKEIALREEKEAVRLKAKKQQSSKNSAKMDTN